MLVPHEAPDKEFLSLSETGGMADIEEMNKILERAVNLNNFLKGKGRIQQVAEFVARHYKENVEPLVYRAFLVGMNHEPALDQFLPQEYSEIVNTGNNNDSPLLKEFHLDPKKKRQIRKISGKLDWRPKITIVTEKALTGFDAPELYAMYLDKPMHGEGKATNLINLGSVKVKMISALEVADVLGWNSPRSTVSESHTVFPRPGELSDTAAW